MRIVKVSDMEQNDKVIKFSDEQLKGWEDYRKILYVEKSKSDDLFEKAITLISSGGLGLTLTFYDKIIPIEKANFILILALGWFLLIITLLINLYSHYLSSKSVSKTIDDVDNLVDYKISHETFQSNMSKRNKKIDILNESSIYLLTIALLSIITYVTINLYNYG